MVIKATPQILTRVSLRWLPDPAFEDTDTVALNVGGYYMDLRVTKADGLLQWSRAGQRITVGSDPLTFQWTRSIDSFGSSQSDEAAFVTLPNGDDLEYGSFTKDEVPTSYEEVWRDTTPEEIAGVDCAWILQSTDGRAFVGKVSNQFMGIRQDEKGGFAARLEVFDGSTGQWRTKFEGDATKSIPTGADVFGSGLEALIKSEGKAAGDTVLVGGREYIIRGVAKHS